MATIVDSFPKSRGGAGRTRVALPDEYFDGEIRTFVEGEDYTSKKASFQARLAAGAKDHGKWGKARTKDGVLYFQALSEPTGRHLRKNIGKAAGFTDEELPF